MKHSSDDKSEALLEQAYKARGQFELYELLDAIERLINLNGNDKDWVGLKVCYH